MRTRKDSFELNLTDEQKKLVVDRARELDLLQLLTDELTAEQLGELEYSEIPDREFLEMLHLLSNDAERRIECQDVLMELGGWPIDDEQNGWRIPNLYVVANNDIEWWDLDALHKKTDTSLPIRVFMFYLVDVNYCVHICSFTPSFELWSMGAQAIPVEEDLDEDQLEELNKLQDRIDYLTSMDVDYTKKCPVGSASYVTCRHLGAPDFALFDQEGDPFGIYGEYMDEMACQLGWEECVQDDMDIHSKVREAIEPKSDN